jgi:SNF2 family DNA or RNA helicase
VYDRYAQAVLSARRDPDGEHIRLRVDGAEWQVGEVLAQLRKLTALPQKTSDGTGEVTVPLTWAIVTQCARLMKDKGYGWKPDPELNLWIYYEFMRRHDDNPHDLRFPLDQLDWTPMPHQVAGMFLGALNKRFFFCDDLRTGKTRTALLTLGELEARGEAPWPAFVVCPASVVDPWLEELAAAFPRWPAVAYRGAKRRGLSTRYKIYVMSWNTFTRDMQHDAHDLPPLLKFVVPKTVVMDEAHALCNVTTKQSVAAGKLSRVADYLFLMSGTPITRDVGGFFRAISCLDTRSFTDQDRYKDSYTDRYKGDYRDEIEGLKPETREEFYLVMQGSMRRIAKRDVNENLPPVSYSTRAVAIPKAHRAAYDEMEEDMIAHIPDTDEPLEVMTTLAQLQRLTQLASSACDVEIEMVTEMRENHPMYGQEVPKYHVTMREPSWKIDELMAIMDENQGTDNPLLVFSPHTQLVNLAGARAEAAGYRVGYITGQQSAAQKRKYRLMHQGGELDLLCCNVTAGGVGLTLNRGDTVVFLERPWAYWQAHQAEGRADNLIEAKQVHVIDIVAVNTVESRVRQALKDKAKALSELVRDPRTVESFLGGQRIKV